MPIPCQPPHSSKTFLEGVLSSITTANTFPTLNLKGEEAEPVEDFAIDDKPYLIAIF